MLFEERWGIRLAERPRWQKTCRCGGIGIRARLRGVWRNPCGFKSRHRHHKKTVTFVTVFFMYMVRALIRQMRVPRNFCRVMSTEGSKPEVTKNRNERQRSEVNDRFSWRKFQDRGFCVGWSEQKRTECRSSEKSDGATKNRQVFKSEVKDLNEAIIRYKSRHRH